MAGCSVDTAAQLIQLERAIVSEALQQHLRQRRRSLGKGDDAAERLAAVQAIIREKHRRLSAVSAGVSELYTSSFESRVAHMSSDSLVVGSGACEALSRTHLDLSWQLLSERLRAHSAAKAALRARCSQDGSAFALAEQAEYLGTFLKVSQYKADLLTMEAMRKAYGDTPDDTRRAVLEALSKELESRSLALHKSSAEARARIQQLESLPLHLVTEHTALREAIAEREDFVRELR